MLSKQLEMARIDEAKEGSLIQVIDPARPPDRKSGPARLWITLGGCVLSFVFSLCWVAGKIALLRAKLDPETDRQLTFLRNTLLFSRNNGSTTT